MDNCIFCKIISKEISCYKVYEDNNVLAFLDIAPVNYGHVLVIPKEHFKNFEEISEERLGDLIKVVKKVGKAIKKGLDFSGYNVCVNNDPVAGQIVPHLHFHIVPRKESDILASWPQGKYKEKDAEKIANKIKNNLEEN